MRKTIVVYGSTTGTCQKFAEQIAQKLGVNDVMNVSEVHADIFVGYNNLLLATSTWGVGELQDDWYDGVDMLRSLDLDGKTVALFGCGDADEYPDTFCGGMAEIYNVVKDSGAKLIGQVAANTYNYSNSEAVVDGNFVGLALDCSESEDKNGKRIDDWIGCIQGEL